ncbi:VOC family protein [Methylocystis sp. H4A]|uniref:VOC family protein n=1 Tax=Methylocystis sp. H4A TaxID=2785788 RepID=UPI0018C2378B|nr:VOC family protein [Methylocystis sp. H4A]MBG0800729.1 VOC family protein [Methylocystis sp. H4A]
MTPTQKVRGCLWFDHEAKEAANFYVSLIPNSRILNIARYGEAGPGKPGSVSAGRRQTTTMGRASTASSHGRCRLSPAGRMRGWSMTASG